MVFEDWLWNASWNVQRKTVALVLCLELLGAALAFVSRNCPLTTGTLQASASESKFEGMYQFDPVLSTAGISMLDDGGSMDDHDKVEIERLRFTNESQVECSWTVTTMDSDHTVTLTLNLSQRKKALELMLEDCWTVYEGQASQNHLGLVCDGEGWTQRTFNSSGSSLLVNFRQGGWTGLRFLVFVYRAQNHEWLKEPQEPKNLSLTQQAALFTGVVIIVGICYLTIKITGCFLPCRKRWCPQHCTAAVLVREDEEEEPVSCSHRPSWQQSRSTAPGDHQSYDARFDSLSAPPPPFETITPLPPPPLLVSGFENGGRNPRSPLVPSPVCGRGEGDYELPTSRISSEPPPVYQYVCGDGVSQPAQLSPPTTPPPPSYESIFGESGV